VVNTLIKAVVFDLGGVFATDPTPLISRKLAKITSLEFDKVHEIVKRNQKTLQEDKITMKRYWINVRKELGKDFDINKIGKSYFDFLVPRSRMIKLAKSLRKEYKVCLLSNTERESFTHWNKKYSFYKIFDVMITSFEVGKRKPDKRIYNTAIKKIGFKPNEIVFIDNEMKNVEGAIKIGIKAIHYDNHRNFINKLNKLL